MWLQACNFKTFSCCSFTHPDSPWVLLSLRVLLLTRPFPSVSSRSRFCPISLRSVRAQKQEQPFPSHQLLVYNREDICCSADTAQADTCTFSSSTGKGRQKEPDVILVFQAILLSPHSSHLDHPLLSWTREGTNQCNVNVCPRVRVLPKRAREKALSQIWRAPPFVLLGWCS